MKRSWWPSPTQEGLLAVALTRESDVVPRWESLRRELDIERLEPGTLAVLPLVYRALVNARVQEPLMGRLKGIYRSVWAKNSLQQERLRETFECFAEKGVNGILLGGLGTGLRFYGDHGLRPVRALDVLVPRDTAPAAARALATLGWKTASSGPVSWFKDDQGNVCILRKHLTFDFGLEPRFSESEDVIDIRGTRVPVLSAGDELLASCVMGARAAPYRAIQWIPDAVLAVRASRSSIDWDRLVELSRDHGQTLRVREAFAYLDRLSLLSFPDQLRVLCSTRVPSRGRLLHALASRTARGQRVSAKFLRTRPGG